MILFVQCSFGQVASDAPIDWTNAGYRGKAADIPRQFDRIVNVKTEFDVKGDGITDDAPKIQRAINAYSDFAVYYFAAGTYLLGSTITLRSNCVILGAGSSNTVFMNTHSNSVFAIKGDVEASVPAAAAAELVKDAQTITLPFSVSAGDFIEISANDPSLVVPGDEAVWYYCIGQVVRVKQVNGSAIMLDDKLRLNYSSLTPKVAKMHTITNVGFENFKVSNQSPVSSSNFSTNFNFSCATDCWISGVESQGSGFAHVGMGSSANIEIQGCYFHEAQDYGEGGHGYGICMTGHSSSCLIENNIFKTLRHAMILAGGANGNVFGFNYSRDVYSSLEPDICFHGHFPFANLIEGNYAEFAQADLVWGLNGPYNTLFRNALNRLPIFICYSFDLKEGGIRVDHQSSFKQHFYVLGNAVRDADCVFNNKVKALYWNWDDLDNEDGNTGLNVVKDGSFSRGERTSYYKDLRPIFLSTAYTWPPLGCKFSGNVTCKSIPAVDRWNAGGVMTLSAPPLFSSPSSINFENTIKNDPSDLILPMVSAPGYAFTINSVTNKLTIFRPDMTVPVTINGNDTLKTKIVFKPTAFGSFIDTLSIMSNSGTGKVILSGSSPYPTVSAYKTAINYGSIAKNTTKKDTVKLVNNSINTLMVDSIYTKTNAFIANRVNGTVGSDTLKFIVSFTPTTLSSYADTLYVWNNSQTPLVKIPLSGNASELPVELVDFSASISKSNIVLRWHTAIEVNNYGFELERRTVNIIQSSADTVWRIIAFITGNGTSNATHEYSYSDASLNSGRYEYRLKQIDNDGAYKYFQSVEVDIPLPRAFSMSQNYPNPYNPSTTIRYALPMRSNVKIQIFNMLGQVVTDLVNNEQAAGYQSVIWNATVAGGIYFYRIEAVDLSDQRNRFVDTKKMILLK